MSRAMRVSAERHPNATRVIRWMLVLDRFDAAVGQAVLDRGLCLTMRLAARLDDAAIPAAAGPADPDLERFYGRGVRQLEDQPEAFLEWVGLVQPRVGLGDPGQYGGSSRSRV